MSAAGVSSASFVVVSETSGVVGAVMLVSGVSAAAPGMHSTSPTISRAGLMSLFASSRSFSGTPRRCAIR